MLECPANSKLKHIYRVSVHTGRTHKKKGSNDGPLLRDDTVYYCQSIYFALLSAFLLLMASQTSAFLIPSFFGSKVGFTIPALS